jgi:hypothetical protein
MLLLISVFKNLTISFNGFFIESFLCQLVALLFFNSTKLFKLSDCIIVILIYPFPFV